MKSEIDDNFFCGTEDEPAATCPEFWWCRDGSHECCDKHRKWPTLEQFREEYGEEWTGAIYAVCGKPCERGRGYLCAEWSAYDGPDHAASSYSSRSCEINVAAPYIVCTCTPWGMPPDDRRPE